MLIAIRTTGLLAILGTLAYAVGDVFLLASKADLANYPKLQPYAKLLSDAEKMVVLPWWRLAWGSLLGVFATPLVLAGFWQLYQGLATASSNTALAPVLLFSIASVVGAFVHGTFYYLGEYVQALNEVGSDSQPVLAGMLARHRKILIITYGFLLACVIAATVWYVVLVAGGHSSFPRWMATINPLTALVAWLAIKKVLPRKVSELTEGAGFNIAYLVFFVANTLYLWEG